MKKSLLLIGTSLLASALVGCGGGGGSLPELSQVEKASRFVRALNEYQRTETTYESVYKSSCDCYRYEYVTRTVTDYTNQYAVAKGISKQAGMAVIMDTWNGGKYFAISMNNGYTGYNSAKAHLDNQTVNGQVYYNLTQDLAAGDYIDPRTGTRFKELTSLPITVDTATIEADRRAARQGLISANLLSLGLNQAAADNAAVIVDNLNQDSQLSISQINKGLEQAIGISLTDAVAAGLSGAEGQNAALDKAVKAGVVSDATAGRAVVENVLKKLGAM